MNDSAGSETFAPAYQPEYDHTQSGPLYLFAAATAVLMPLVAILLDDEQAAVVLLLGGLLVIVVSLTIQSLRVVDEDDLLAIRYGPLPLWRRRIRYDQIASAVPDRSSFIDGWGIHWVPGRGWTYNVWGFDCVRLTLTSGSTIRVGTDDPEGLAEFVNKKCAAP